MTKLTYHYMLILQEHGNIDDAEMHSLVAAVGAVPGCSPVVRIPAPDAWLVKRALDTGAHALMCPMVSNVVCSPLCDRSPSHQTTNLNNTVYRKKPNVS